MDKMSNDWEEEPEWRSLAVAGTQLYIERVVWEHLVLAEAAEAPGSVTGPLPLEEAHADWEEEPEWRRLAVAGTQVLSLFAL